MSISDCTYDYRYEQPTREPQVIAECSHCGAPVTEDDSRYELEDEVIIHEDCLVYYMYKYFKG